MSRIAKQIIKLPDSVKCSVIDNNILCQGPLGNLNVPFINGYELKVDGRNCEIIKTNASANSCNHGTIVANLKNAVAGVVKKFEKKINLVGVGYKVLKNGSNLEFHLGYSHPINVLIEDGLEVEIIKPTEFIIKGIDKILVGNFCSKIAKLRKVEPYKGKGVVLEGKFILRKEGKRK